MHRRSPKAPAPRPPRRQSQVATLLTAVAVAGLAAGCGSGDGDDQATLSPQAQAGADLRRSEGCVACHSVDGSGGLGPTWKGIWGTEVELEGGGMATVDGDYVAESIREPQAKVVGGFSTQMPKFDLTDEQVDAVTAYIRALGDDTGS